ncbi:hypothetical protein G7Y79_00005g016820 [Physcia stellaris]|nr:hypothetical protein G7Y79_00005g016820 [Physcia stellaris]
MSHRIDATHVATSGSRLGACKQQPLQITHPTSDKLEYPNSYFLKIISGSDIDSPNPSSDLGEMFSRLGFLTFLLLSCFICQIACIPFEERALSARDTIPLASPILNHANVSSLPLVVPSVGDWENFAYPIPNSKRILKGRIFTNRPLRRNALHFAIDGGIARANSKVLGGEAVMSYGNMVEVLEALEQLLENQQRFLETSFVLTDKDQKTWGHGEIFEKEPLSVTSYL